MSRSIEVASTLGGLAVAGLGLAPFLHRADAPNRWFELQWPRDVDEPDVLALLRHLAASRRPEVVAFELHVTRGVISHMVGVTKSDVERLQHALATFLPGVLLTPVDRPELTLHHAVELRIGSRERALRVDAPSEVTRSLLGSVHGATGTVVIQWLVGPRLAPRHVAADSVGLPTTPRVLSQALSSGVKTLDAKSRTALQGKVGDHGFRARLLIGSSISQPRVAHGVLRRIIGGLRVAEAPGVHWRVRKTNHDALVAGTPPRRWGVAINSQELTGLLGWPLGDAAYPGVTRIASRRLPVPVAIAKTGRVIGEGNHPATQRPVGLDMRDALLHTHVLGPTGTGKSTLLANLVIQDINAGRGVVVVEPKGDLVADVLARIPKHRERDVVVLDPSDVVAPVGLNPLSGGAPELVADQLLSVLRGLYGDLLGPRTTDVLQAALLTLARSDRATLVALPVLLTDARLRAELTAPVRGDLALGPFWKWYDGLSDGERQAVIAPSLNKIRRFLHAPTRDVVGQLSPRFDVSQVFTQRKILLVPLPKGSLGAETAGLIGSLLVARLWQAAQGRARIAPERRHPVSVVIDEFQDFLHLPTDLADVLAQARSLGVGITLAHQHLAQLSPDVRAAVLANARNRVCFRLSADDASNIAKTSELLDSGDLQSLGKYEVYASLVADSESQAFCSAHTWPLPKLTSDPDHVRTLSREQFGRDLGEVETELHQLVGSPSDSKVGKRQRGGS